MSLWFPLNNLSRVTILYFYHLPVNKCFLIAVWICFPFISIYVSLSQHQCWADERDIGLPSWLYIIPDFISSIAQPSHQGYKGYSFWLPHPLFALFVELLSISHSITCSLSPSFLSLIYITHFITALDWEAKWWREKITRIKNWRSWAVYWVLLLGM